jgi:hypothetical protein
MKRGTPALGALILAGLALGAFAPPVGADDANAVIAKMTQRNAALSSYRTRVHVDVHMQSFPFLSPTLDGTSYYKRPDRYEIVFDRVPGYAKGFSRLFNDVGDPGSWGKLNDIAIDGQRELNGRPMIVLRLTKKIHSDILAYALAFVDAQSYTLPQMEWHYTSGGVVTMTQTYRQEGAFWLISTQHATIRIPYVHAVADASYAPYQTNVPVDSQVFATK